ncbi:MAG: type II toxin-antitoxin system RelB/DinJ family antitoxin [Thermoguttaceae bacterium]
MTNSLATSTGVDAKDVAGTILPLAVFQSTRERELMQTTYSDIRVRVDTTTKKNAATVLTSMGLSLSDAVRMLITKVADERCLPFEAKIPNAETRQAIAELEAGGGKTFATVEEFMADLYAED